MNHLTSVTMPSNVDEALADLNVKWAIKKEMDAMATP